MGLSNTLKTRMKWRRQGWRFGVAVLVACWQMAAAAQDLPLSMSVQKVQIVHVGPPAVSDEFIRANLRIREGEAFQPRSLDEDVKKLYGTGYFYNIRVLEERGSGGMNLQLVVQGHPVITEIRYTGNKKFSTRRIRKKVTSKVGEPMVERKLFTDAREVLKMYQKSGLQKTRVEYRPSINEALGRATVTFEIVEAPKVKVDDVEFVGATEIRQGKLRRAVKTRRWWWLSWLTGSGKLKDEVLDEDRDRLREYYAERGYIDFELKGIDIQNPKSTNRAIVHFDVEEGVQYKVGDVQFEGNSLFTKDQIVADLRSQEGDKIRTGLQLSPGEVFTPGRLRKDVEAIDDFYGARGYIEARAFPQRVPNVEAGTLDMVYEISEGEKFYVERVDIRGNTKTKDKVIRRELAIFPGETFDMVRVKVSKSRLEQMQFFERVEADPEDTQIENRKNLVINVEEKNTGNIQVGAGFSSIDALVGFAEVSQGNFDLFNPPHFTGGGQKARLRVQAGTRRQDYMLNFSEPWFLGRRLNLNVDLYHRDLRFFSDNYDQQQTGGRVGLRRQLARNFVGEVSYTLESINLDISDSYKNRFPDTVILEEDGRRLVSRAGFVLGHDTRNSVMLPSRGHRVEFLSDLAGGPFGGDVDYYRLELRTSQYLSPARMFSPTSTWQDILGGHILELTGRVGIIDAYGDGDRGRGDRVPLFDRWFMGGLYSLRGYRFRDVGPRDPVSFEPSGGGTFWFGGAEYSVPIIERLRFAVFYDVGMVYPDAYSFSPQEFIDGDGRFQTTRFYNDNWGVGLRLNLPIGPLRLDYGIPMTHDTRAGGSGRFQFGVGYTRDF